MCQCYHIQAPQFKHCTLEVSVRVMSVFIWSLCAWPVVDWVRAMGLCPLWCSDTAGMGWSLPTWQRAMRVSRSAPNVLSCTSAPVHLFTESTNKPCKRSWHTRQPQNTVLNVKVSESNLESQILLEQHWWLLQHWLYTTDCAFITLEFYNQYMFSVVIYNYYIYWSLRGASRNVSTALQHPT